MMSDIDAILDDILCRWAQWCRPVSSGRGYNHSALVCGQYRTSRQYDDTNGALDDAIEHARMKAVDFQVGEMLDPWRTAIHAEGRRLVVGVDVYLSPRLPTGKAERADCISKARVMILGRLERAGVM